MFDVTTTLILMTFTGAIFYLLGKADGLNVGRVKTNELVRDAVRMLENALEMMDKPEHVSEKDVKWYLRRNIRNLKDGEKLE